MRYILLLLLLDFPLLSTAFTSSTSGNWNLSATWGGAGVPGNGDTASVSDGTTVTISDSRIVGTSASAATIILTMNNSGALVIANGGYLKLRGSCQYAANFGGNTTTYFTVQAGGILEFDSSLATPTSTTYHCAPDVAFGFRPFVTTGTSINHAIIRSNAGGGNGYFTTPNSVGGIFNLMYTDISSIGDATNYAFFNWGVNWTSMYSTFTSCGTAPYAQNGMASTDIFKHDYNVYTGSLGSTTLHRGSQGPNPPIASGGVREMVGNVFDIVVDPTGGDWTSFTIHSNYFASGFGTLSLGSVPWALFQNNFYRTPPNYGNSFITLNGDSLDNYWLLDMGASNNMHGIGLGSHSETLSGNIIDHPGSLLNSMSAANLSNISTSNPSTVLLSYNILLPNATGYSSFWLADAFGVTGTTNDYEHNTAIVNGSTSLGGGSNGGSALILAHPTTPANPTNSITFRNNNLWTPLGATGGYKTQALQNINSNACLPVNCNYNNGYGTLTDGGGFTGGANGYADNFSGGTPGVNDLAVNPMFLDSTRNLATFDSAYLKNTALAWSSGTTYNVGNFVSSTDPTVYAGATINYRYVNGTGCFSANPKPGLIGAWASATNGSPNVDWVSGDKFVQASFVTGMTLQVANMGGIESTYTVSSLANCTAGLCTRAVLSSNFTDSTQFIAAYITSNRTCWEWASLYRIRQAIAAQTLYEDSSIGVYGNDIITTLMQWVRAGYSPSNAQLSLAGSDGFDIGAVPAQLSPITFSGTNTNTQFQGVMKGATLQ